MNDPSRWSLECDPPRDETLGRLLRSADGTAPGTDVNWEDLRAAIMHGVGAPGAGTSVPGRQWADVVVGWGRIAAAASLAAILAAGLLVWRTSDGPAELALGDDDAPEAVALARVVAAYPDDAVLTSLLQTARDDELTSWSGQ